jgi:hypothetical protein
MEHKDNKSEQQSANGYGKRPLWQWLVLYLIVGGIVYFLIYLLAFHHGTSSGGGLKY